MTGISSPSLEDGPRQINRMIFWNARCLCFGPTTAQHPLTNNCPTHPGSSVNYTSRKKTSLNLILWYGSQLVSDQHCSIQPVCLFSPHDSNVRLALQYKASSSSMLERGSPKEVKCTSIVPAPCFQQHLPYSISDAQLRGEPCAGDMIEGSICFSQPPCLNL